MENVENDPVQSSEWIRLRRAAAGDTAAWSELIERHRPRLRKMIALRMDRRIRGRVDASDVLQEASIEALRTLPSYLERPEFPFFIWMRWLTGMTLQGLHRKHLEVQARGASREVRLFAGGMPEATSAALAMQLLGRDTRPSLAAARAERKLRLQEAVESLNPLDREILVLRHFEELTAEESAKVLGIERSAASRRYMRALKRLKELIEALPGGEEGFRL
jgi:RNA polymerase sigma-70 factor (ECF subfamily)